MDSERFSVLDGLVSGAPAASAAAPGATSEAAPEATPEAAPGAARDTAPDAGSAEAPETETGAPEPAGFTDIPAPAAGDPRVDDAVAGLATLGGRPLEEHPPVFEAVHDTLRELLGELGEPGRPGRPGQQGELGGGR